MTNTIPNVPRELLERARNLAFQTQHYPLHEELRTLLSAPSPANHVEDVRAMVADPSPAGVDGLDVVATAILGGVEYGIGGPELGEIDVELSMCTLCRIQEQMVSNEDSVYLDLCSLSDATAIIDGLRGEVEVMTQHANNYSRMFEECAEERDHLAQCLKFARTTMAVVANNANLRGVEYRSLVTEVKRIDAALSAVCAAAPNIATTSEHSGS